MTKTKAETKRQANGARESAPKAAGKGNDASQGANASQSRAAHVEAFLKDNPEKRAKPRTVAPILSQAEKDKRAVLQALGHDAAGKCPVAVDWRGVRSGAVVGMPAELHRATWAAQDRAFCTANRTGVAPAESFPKCGWWFCGVEASALSESRWADLRQAAKLLQDAGVKPNGAKLAALAGAYAEFTARAKQWKRGESEHVWAYLEAKKRTPEGAQALSLLRGLSDARWAAWPKGTGKPVGANYHRFLNGFPSPTAAAAGFVLCGLSDRSLASEIRRAEATWNRGDELNARKVVK